MSPENLAKSICRFVGTVPDIFTYCTSFVKVGRWFNDKVKVLPPEGVAVLTMLASLASVVWLIYNRLSKRRLTFCPITSIDRLLLKSRSAWAAMLSRKVGLTRS